MKKLVSFLFALALIAGVALALYGLAATTPQAPGGSYGATPATRVMLPQTFVLMDIRPGNGDAYYRCPETWSVWYNPATSTCEKIPVNMTFGGLNYGPWNGFQLQTHLMARAYGGNPAVPWASGTTGLAGKVYIFGAEADGELRTMIPGFGDDAKYLLGTFKKGADTVIPFDGLYTDFGAVNQYTTVQDAMNFEFNARVYFRIEITAYYSSAAQPTNTPTTAAPTDTPVPPTNTPVPPTPTPTIPAGCVLHSDNKMWVCLTPAP